MEALSKAAADLFVQAARSSVEARGRFVVALSGGHSPERTYQLLASVPYRDQVAWDKTYVFWGDERCVPRDDPRNNARTAFAMLLNHVPIPRGHIHPIPSEELPSEAADRYETTLRNFFRTQPPRFDLIFLGLGEDGHTASLFPNTTILEEWDRWAKEVYLTDQNMYRVSLTAPTINQAATIAFLVCGSNKSRVLREVLSGPGRPQELPAQLIGPIAGDLLWLVDDEAARELPAED